MNSAFYMIDKGNRYIILSEYLNVLGEGKEGGPTDEREVEAVRMEEINQWYPLHGS